MIKAIIATLAFSQIVQSKAIESNKVIANTKDTVDNLSVTDFETINTESNIAGICKVPKPDCPGWLKQSNIGPSMAAISALDELNGV